ncbi:hypothetical protein MWU59_14390, partial [Flavobacteriaceae bacterium F08102]|nr:hypothetical protein [Flavobacteriaceae bacterium F08102]
SWRRIAEKTVNKNEKVMTVCDKLNRSRSAFYKAIASDVTRLDQYDVIKSKVLYYRGFMTELGSKKLFHLLGPELVRENIKIGRDKFI